MTKNNINIYDIGKYLLDNCPKKYGSGITQLQKLLYYAQVESLIQYHKPLFEEEIQAWDLGPVIPTVYFEFARYMAEKKDLFEEKCTKNPFPCETIKILNLVLEKYGSKTPQQLIEQTHQEIPWKTTYHPNKKFSNSVIHPKKILASLPKK
ncbi:MAG: DUF4065 domain-containing protein [Sweet potato little leaf phytoplasma]|nr:DUF4065 domain-containing protein [Pigeon pea little leaf phytoplasma]MDV3196610.1 DUF4065 domain-containing protein [Pigeon pea little leaf phytoplasma]MDV3204568.1 DUF4065 domain-containing protein [Sweet potato little leaf phytoplasma]